MMQKILMHFKYWLRYSSKHEKDELCYALVLSLNYLRQIAGGHSNCSEHRKLDIINNVFKISGKLVNFEEKEEFMNILLVE